MFNKDFNNAIVYPIEKIVKVGKYRFHPLSDVYLEDVNIKINSNETIIRGIRRKFNIIKIPSDSVHPISKEELARIEKEYVIEESDWYKRKPSKFCRFFGAKEKMVLEDKAYMLRKKFGKETYIFQSNCVLIYNGKEYL